jgi:hypothetical protein
MDVRMDEQAEERANERPLLYPDEPLPEEFEALLCRLHDLKRLWRACGRKACKRARRCRGDLGDCIRWFPATANWQLRFLNATWAGLSGAEAIREANRIAYGIDDPHFRC